VRIDGPDERDDAGSRDVLSDEASFRESESPEAMSREALSGEASTRAGARRHVADRAEAGDGEAGDGERTGGRDEAGRTDAEVRAERALGYRAEVEAVYRAYAIDQGCARVERIERETVTPAMRRIEAEDPGRHLAGLEHRLKGKDRLSEKVENYLKSNAELSTDQAFAKVKDAIRYTFQYDDQRYTEGVLNDVERLKGRFELVDARNLWPEAEYKGVNSRWRIPADGQVFEVQFHTEASLEAKEATHAAYEKIRSPETSKEERSELQDYQRRVSAGIPVPPNVNEIPNYP
jgi:hypothetical protein